MNQQLTYILKLKHQFSTFCSIGFNCSDGAVYCVAHYGFLSTTIRQSHGAESGTDLRVKQ
jgi:hypothetical protein